MQYFKIVKFKDCDLNDSFFDSLKKDYGKQFEIWFSTNGEKEAYVFEDNGVQAFLSIKEDECEEITLVNSSMPRENRMKIRTLKLSEKFQGQRAGEGTIGLALWRWQASNVNQIYVTVFEKHKALINLLEKFGFINVGNKENGERVYVKDKRKLDYSNGYKFFPYLDPDIKTAGYLPIEDSFHDSLFAYSEVARNKLESIRCAAGNGITKVFIATPYTSVKYIKNEPILIYRKHNGANPGYKSVITSYCSILEQVVVKKDGAALCSMEEYLAKVGNKSIYSELDLRNIYYNQKNVVILEMLYCGYFGEGNNVNWSTLKAKGLLGESHPYQTKLSKDEFIMAVELAKIDKNKVYSEV